MPTFPGMPAYVLLAAVAVADMALLTFLPVRVSPGQIGAHVLVGLLPLLAVLALARRILRTVPRLTLLGRARLERIETLLQGLAFLQLAWIVLRLYNHLTMALAFPLADDLLISADALLRFDWPAYFDFVTSRPGVMAVLDASYWSLTNVSLAAFVLLVMIGQVTRARYFVETFLVTAIVCSTIGFLFPAEAAVKTFIGGPDFFSGPQKAPGLYHLAHLDALRSGLPVTLDLADLPGLVTFPSFHTAAGVLLILCFRHTVLFWPVLAYALVMIAATPVQGGHYLIDLVAGGLVALIVAASVRRLAYRDEFLKTGDRMPAHSPNAASAATSGVGE